MTLISVRFRNLWKNQFPPLEKKMVKGFSSGLQQHYTHGHSYLTAPCTNMHLYITLHLYIFIHRCEYGPLRLYLHISLPIMLVMMNENVRSWLPSRELHTSPSCLMFQNKIQFDMSVLSVPSLLWSRPIIFSFWYDSSTFPYWQRWWWV